jgi:hypothetical protein
MSRSSVCFKLTEHVNVETQLINMTASAFAELGYEYRKLQFMGSFNGYQCSWCECRFSTAKVNVPKNLSLAQRRRRLAIHCKRDFAAHVCSKRACFLKVRPKNAAK